MQKVLYTAQNVHSRVGCAKSALYNTKCTLESRMFKKCSTQRKMRKKSTLSSTKCTLENKSALYSTKCTLESKMYKKTVFVHRILRHIFRLENGSFLYMALSRVHFVLYMAVFVLSYSTQYKMYA